MKFWFFKIWITRVIARYLHTFYHPFHSMSIKKKLLFVTYFWIFTFELENEGQLNGFGISILHWSALYSAIELPLLLHQKKIKKPLNSAFNHLRPVCIPIHVFYTNNEVIFLSPICSWKIYCALQYKNIWRDWWAFFMSPVPSYVCCTFKRMNGEHHPISNNSKALHVPVLGLG